MRWEPGLLKVEGAIYNVEAICNVEAVCNRDPYGKSVVNRGCNPLPRHTRRFEPIAFENALSARGVALTAPDIAISV